VAAVALRHGKSQKQTGARQLAISAWSQRTE